MSSSLRSILVLLAVLAAAANVQAAGKGHPPAHQAHQVPNHLAHAKTAAKGHPPAAHQARKAPNHVSHTKVDHHRRPAVQRRPVQRAQRSATRTVRQSVRPAVVRTAHRYSVHRVQRRFLRRPYYSSFSSGVRRNVGVASPTLGLSRPHSSGFYPGVRRYTYFYYPGRYVWRTSHYNRGFGASRRRASRGMAGIVESVQGNANNGMLLVKSLRPHSSRFRYATTNAAARRGVTSLHRFHLNNGTRYEVLTNPRRGGTIADLHKGEHVMIQPHAHTANTAQTVQVSPLRKR